MKHKVYIDGQAGTTGLQLRQKLQNHKDVEILLISEELRKDEAERKRLMNEAEVVFLCLPDDAAKEAVKLVENPNTPFSSFSKQSDQSQVKSEHLHY